MSRITIQVLEGVERGRCYADLPAPVTIGREEENIIRLNDERVSRFHAKLQDDGGRLILTDLQSTNGTRVNGRPVQVRVLRPGDQIAIGRCLLLFGSPEEIIAWAEKLHPPPAAPRSEPTSDDLLDEADSDSALDVSNPGSGSDRFGANVPPKPPTGLAPGQRAQLSDLLDHIHNEIRHVLTSAEELPTSQRELPRMRVNGTGWQRLLRLEMDLAVSLGQVVEPEEDE